jgi:hypothetical protein
MRESVGRQIMRTFIGANVVVLIALAVLAWLDQNNLDSHLITPGERLINSHVLMALLGATAVQVGSIAVFIARDLFSGRRQ